MCSRPSLVLDCRRHPQRIRLFSLNDWVVLISLLVHFCLLSCLRTHFFLSLSLVCRNAFCVLLVATEFRWLWIWLPENFEEWWRCGVMFVEWSSVDRLLFFFILFTRLDTRSTQSCSSKLTTTTIMWCVLPFGPSPWNCLAPFPDLFSLHYFLFPAVLHPPFLCVHSLCWTMTRFLMMNCVSWWPRQQRRRKRRPKGRRLFHGQRIKSAHIEVQRMSRFWRLWFCMMVCIYLTIIMMTDGGIWTLSGDYFRISCQFAVFDYLSFLLLSTFCHVKASFGSFH